MWTLTPARARDDTGQASVELLALLPALALIIALAVQALLMGETWWLASVAAREGARASALGRDPADAAMAAMPRALRPSRVTVSSTSEGTVTVKVPIPALLSGLRLGTATGRARMEPQR